MTWLPHATCLRNSHHIFKKAMVRTRHGQVASHISSIPMPTEATLDLELKIPFKKRENETTYKLYCLSKEESTDSIIFYLNQLKKFKTIS